jgi:hypothetical protein
VIAPLAVFLVLQLKNSSIGRIRPPWGQRVKSFNQVTETQVVESYKK